MMKTIIFIMLNTLFIAKIIGQNDGCYHKYTFEQFLNVQTLDSVKYMREIYKLLRFPGLEAEKGNEGLLKVTLINHTADSTEILLSGCENMSFRAEAYKAVELTNSKFLIQSKENYFTAFFIQFDLEPFDENENRNLEPKSDLIKVLRYKPVIKYDNSN